MDTVETVDMAELIAELAPGETRGGRSGLVSGIAYASGDVVTGGGFVAIRGRKTDGHRFIADALSRGAVLIVGEDPAPPDFPADRTYVRVVDSRRALGTLSAAFYGHPTRSMEVIGVTGTDGKTTTTKLIDSILTAAGRRTGLMSTVDFKVGDESWLNNSRLTTLEAPEVQRLLKQMLQGGVEVAVVETTSSGLELHRVWGVEYDVAVMTNITSEHLEVHGTVENYRRAKAMLFEAVDPAREKTLPADAAVPRACVLNADDSSFEYLKPFCRAPIWSYGISQPADVRAEDVALESSGTSFQVTMPGGERIPVRTQLVGRFNVSNCLAALSVGYLHGVAPLVMAEALAKFPGVSGRMERIEARQSFTVVVDYAHTAESLANVLRVLRPVTAGRLIAVFGSAGDRDRMKRPEMGAVAARLADFSVITDEDPREEDAASILREIAAGAVECGAKEGRDFVCVVGRRLAIATALRLARPDDTVLLAGKGHEQSLIIGKEKLPWDDRVVAREELMALGYGGGG
ncbi:MAG: UDP-N-acetylmuramoyl-L-alanyl-D-glutamate--2,6-diaminopimelate ligase [Ktedonobacterales bacterium]